MLFALKDIFRIYRVNAVKNLSQNFIFDEKLLKRIAAVPDVPTGNTLAIEVGPAAGNLSRALLGRGFQQLLLVEKDPRFKPALEQLHERSQGKLKFVIDDAMKMNRSWLNEYSNGVYPESLLIFGNLPFAIATPLTLQLIKEFSQRGSLESIFYGIKQAQMVLMYQEEVARKITAKVGTSMYGRLGVMAQTFCKSVDYIEKIPAHKFTPKPKVDAGVVKFNFDFESPQGIFNELEKLTCSLFRHRNKKLALDPQLQINPDWRPHHLSPVALQKILEFQRKQKTSLEL